MQGNCNHLWWCATTCHSSARRYCLPPLLNLCIPQPGHLCRHLARWMHTRQLGAYPFCFNFVFLLFYVTTSSSLLKSQHALPSQANQLQMSLFLILLVTFIHLEHWVLKPTALNVIIRKLVTPIKKLKCFKRRHWNLKNVNVEHLNEVHWMQTGTMSFKITKAILTLFIINGQQSSAHCGEHCSPLNSCHPY